jgi:hypothetical protein
MFSKEEMEEFISYASDKLYFYIESKFWSKPNFEDWQKWYSNFDSLKEKYCAMKLLDRFVYYSEDDIIRLIKYGINEKILNRYILKLEIESDFILPNKDIVAYKNKLLKNIAILPLSTGNPSESSLAMLRYLTNSIGFPEEQILNVDNLSSERLKDFDMLIIIDDFVGSGKQIQDFWNFKKILLDGEEILFNHIKSLFPKLELDYFCLVCTQEGYEKFKFNDEVGLRSDLRITYGEMLTNKFKVFSKDSIYFENEEMEDCKNVIQNLCECKNVEFLGYRGLDYAIAFHHSIPDSSLPLFYTLNPTWNFLHRNKKTASYDNI